MPTQPPVQTFRTFREDMPQTAEFIDALRQAFGGAMVSAAIRNGLAGGSDFHATENGHSIGTPAEKPGASFTVNQLLGDCPP